VISWTCFLKTETNPAGGSNYTITGTSQLLSVPYAMHAKTVESLSAESDPVFSASPANGITDADDSNTNEIQALSHSRTQLSPGPEGGTEHISAGAMVLPGIILQKDSSL